LPFLQVTELLNLTLLVASYDGYIVHFFGEWNSKLKMPGLLTFYCCVLHQ